MLGFEEIFATYRTRVLALCLHVTAHEADAEDAVQDTFVAVLRGLSRFRGECEISTWIYRIAIRSALRVRARRPKTASLDVDPAIEPGDPALRREDARRVRVALSRLSSAHRVALALSSLKGLSHREIAETLGIPEGTVWSRLHLARKKLAAELTALGYAPRA